MSLVNKKQILNAVLVLTLLAIGVHVYLTNHYFGIKLGVLENNSLCNVSEAFNCDTVSASKFSSFLGVPMALWGAVTNFIFLLLVLILRFNLSETPKTVMNYVLAVATGTAVASIVMGTISLTAIGTYCLFCIAAYVISFINLGLLLAGAKGFAKGFLEDLKALATTHRSYLGLFAAVPIFAFIGNNMILNSYGLDKIEQFTAEKVAYWAVAPAAPFDLTKGLIYQKSNQEPVMTIVEFADFRCPHCKHAYPSLHAFTDAHPDVKLVFKPFPLDGVCNSALNGGDGVSCKLAYATLCAEKNFQKGWAVHDYIFDNQETISRSANVDEDLKKMSETLKIADETLKSCINEDESIKQLIREMAQEGVTAKIQGTPTVFVNGKLLLNGQNLNVLEAAYKSIKK